MDIFDEYIRKNKGNEKCRALTCRSYKNVYQSKYHKELDDKQTNFELATYGDALIKFALCCLLLDKFHNLSEYKKQYEEDKFLIEVVAKHYGLLDYMNFDRNNDKIPQEYIFNECEKHINTKYIATTVEAVVGAIYQENGDFDSICNLINSWINLQ